MSKKWEYKVIGWNGVITTSDDSDLQNLLNKHGLAGWELVGIVPQVESSANSNAKLEYVGTTFNNLIFKKERE